MLNLFDKDFVESTVFTVFCQQFPQINDIIDAVKYSTETLQSSSENADTWTRDIRSTLEGIYDLPIFDSKTKDFLSDIPNALDRWAHYFACREFNDEAALQQVSAFCSLSEQIYRAFPTMGEAFVDGTPNLCDALLTAGIQKERNGPAVTDNVLYSWWHPVALLPLYELVLDLTQASQELDGAMLTNFSADSEYVVYYETLYNRFLNRYNFFQPYRGQLYWFQLDVNHVQGPCIVGTPYEQLYALHAVSPYRLAEKICYSVKERIVHDHSVSVLQFALVGHIDRSKLKPLTQLLLFELRSNGPLRKSSNKLTLEITIFDSLCNSLSFEESDGDLFIRWWFEGNVELSDSQTLSDIFQKYDVAFFLDLAALYRPKTQEFQMPDRLPTLLQSSSSQQSFSAADFWRIQQHTNYLVQFFREQSASYLMRCSAQKLDLNTALFNKIKTLYKNCFPLFGKIKTIYKDDLPPIPRVVYAYLSHHELFGQATVKYENISRIENYDGAQLAIIRHSNLTGEFLATGQPELLPVTLWQILKSLRSDISHNLFRYLCNGKYAPFSSVIQSEWELIYVLRRVYIAMDVQDDIVHQDALQFHCLVDQEDLTQFIHRKGGGSDSIRDQELSEQLETLRQFAQDLFLQLWDRIKEGMRTPSKMSDYAIQLHSAFSKAMYGGSCELDHILLWHLYEDGELLEKACTFAHDSPLAELKYLNEAIRLSKRASDQPTDKHFFAYLINNADSGRLGIMDTQRDVELHKYYYLPWDAEENLEQELMDLKKRYGQIAKTCSRLGYTDSILYENAITQSEGL